jgi:hypothetical protein
MLLGAALLYGVLAYTLAAAAILPSIDFGRPFKENLPAFAFVVAAPITAPAAIIFSLIVSRT